MSDVFQRCHERRKAKLLSRHRITDWPKVSQFVLYNDMYLFQIPVKKYDCFKAVETEGDQIYAQYEHIKLKKRYKYRDEEVRKESVLIWKDRKRVV